MDASLCMHTHAFTGFSDVFLNPLPSSSAPWHLVTHKLLFLFPEKFSSMEGPKRKKKKSPTDDCNLGKKYAFYQGPHVANAN